MPAARRHDDQPRCDQCNNYGDWCEAADEYRCDSCWLSEEAAEAERHDAFLHKLVDDEYWFKVRAAKIVFDLEVGTAADKLRLNLISAAERASLFAAADKKFTDIIAEARADKPVRLAKLRANDEASEREIAA
ncbi:MAG: hypothetical protein G4V63_33030 [Candidatus Afipia apatlaquensis]|uniref:Uncharacterized protein n=1 Tax=Candidatus Afipia apatlaquensis TaxID=2712852 RepID=A0A7C9VRD6_9BRAD|nr:hypothetical protein [Candidatus Afipia apatlaquensis]